MKRIQSFFERLLSPQGAVPEEEYHSALIAAFGMAFAFLVLLVVIVDLLW